MHAGCMYYDLDLKAKAGSSERKHKALLWPAVSMHSGKVRNRERTVDPGKYESIGKGKKSFPYQNIMMNKYLLGKLRKIKQKEGKRETGRENIQHVVVSKHTISREKYSCGREVLLPLPCQLHEYYSCQGCREKFSSPEYIYRPRKKHSQVRFWLISCLQEGISGCLGVWS